MPDITKATFAPGDRVRLSPFEPRTPGTVVARPEGSTIKGIPVVFDGDGYISYAVMGCLEKTNA